MENNKNINNKKINTKIYVENIFDKETLLLFEIVDLINAIEK